MYQNVDKFLVSNLTNTNHLNKFDEIAIIEKHIFSKKKLYNLGLNHF